MVALHVRILTLYNRRCLSVCVCVCGFLRFSSVARRRKGRFRVFGVGKSFAAKKTARLRGENAIKSEKIGNQPKNFISIYICGRTLGARTESATSSKAEELRRKGKCSMPLRKGKGCVPYPQQWTRGKGEDRVFYEPPAGERRRGTRSMCRREGEGRGRGPRSGLRSPSRVTSPASAS